MRCPEDDTGRNSAQPLCDPENDRMQPIHMRAILFSNSGNGRQAGWAASIEASSPGAVRIWPSDRCIFHHSIAPQIVTGK